MRSHLVDSDPLPRIRSVNDVDQHIPEVVVLQLRPLSALFEESEPFKCAHHPRVIHVRRQLAPRGQPAHVRCHSRYQRRCLRTLDVDRLLVREEASSASHACFHRRATSSFPLRLSWAEACHRPSVHSSSSSLLHSAIRVQLARALRVLTLYLIKLLCEPFVFPLPSDELLLCGFIGHLRPCL